MNAMGHPSKLPMRLTTLSNEFIVHTAMRARRTTIELLITFLRAIMCLHTLLNDRRALLDGVFPPSARSADKIVRQVISRAGKFCNGKVKITAIE